MSQIQHANKFILYKLVIDFFTKSYEYTAKSTMCNFPIRRCCCPSSPFSLRSIVMVKIACERDDAAFILVAPTDPRSRVVIKKFHNKNRFSKV